jgi:uncharacterized protein YbjT (DUF2867 family)
MITIMGATGHTGGVAATHLLDAGEAVRVVGRSADRLSGLTTRGAEASVGDATDPAFLTQAFRGADVVYALIAVDYSRPDVLDQYERGGDAIAQALEASGVRRAVFLSSVGAELPAGTGPIVGLHRAEERLKGIAGLALLRLRAGYFYENHFATLGLIRHQDVDLGAIPPDVPIPTIAAADIGAFAAEALRARDFTGTRVRELLGPRELTMRQAARALGKRIGKPDLEYRQLPADIYVDGLAAAGFPLPVAQLLLELATALGSGRAAAHGAPHEQRRGRIAFEDFAEVLARAYRAA